jgi:tellurite resistance-related uncharacterized protein
MFSRILNNLGNLTSKLYPHAFRTLAIMHTTSRGDAESYPTLTAGAGVPDEAQPPGSMYFRTDGSLGSLVYVRYGGAWHVLSVLAGGVKFRAVGSGGSITEVDHYLFVTATQTLALPTPTAGKELKIKADAGVTVTLTLTRSSSGVQDYTGSMVSSTQVLPNEGVTLVGTGSVWVRFP